MSLQEVKITIMIIQKHMTYNSKAHTFLYLKASLEYLSLFLSV